MCVCVSVCVCVCPANILVFYFSDIRRDIDLKCIQDTYGVVLNSQKNIDLHRSKVNVTGTVHWFLKVQSYHNKRPLGLKAPLSNNTLYMIHNPMNTN